MGYPINIIDFLYNPIYNNYYITPLKLFLTNLKEFVFKDINGKIICIFVRKAYILNLSKEHCLVFQIY